MTVIDKKPDTFSSSPHSDLSSRPFQRSTDCSPFQNWDGERLGSETEKAVLFMSLVATLKIQPALDASLEAKAVKFLESVDPRTPKSADAFLRSLARNPDESITHFVQSFPVLITTPSKAITTATVEMLKTLIMWCSAKVRLALIKADLIPQLINTVNPLSLSLTEAESIHMYLLKIISYSLWLATPNELEYLKISDNNEQQAVRETQGMNDPKLW
ncbi:hypothetical protein BLNAU_23059 [Blattamonas nauphoetae]|uniref:Uncharacterized protein n=1 Tax=Blattamonas nauphoetae TaxID=2049346 RepID=A0ABQ9WR99_9EUKA|nr:hypothetical protein BLNAU_23059 [Blattamonas nauphoetae]